MIATDTARDTVAAMVTAQLAGARTATLDLIGEVVELPAQQRALTLGVLVVSLAQAVTAFADEVGRDPLDVWAAAIARSHSR